VTKYLRGIDLKKKGFIWLTVSQVFSSWSSGCLETCGEAEHHGRRVWQWSCLPHGCQEAERKELGIRHTSRGHAPSDLLPPTRSSLVKEAHFPISHGFMNPAMSSLMKSEPSWSNHFPKATSKHLLHWGPSLQCTNFWEMLNIQTTTGGERKSGHLA
jgi:hypothetical protein